jgi:hypothetical protein
VRQKGFVRTWRGNSGDRGPAMAWEWPTGVAAPGVRLRFDDSEGSSAVNWPRFSEKLASPLLVLVGILEALDGAGAAVGEESGQSSDGSAPSRGSCGSLCSICATSRQTGAPAHRLFPGWR